MQPSSQAVLPPSSSRAATNTVNTGGHAIPYGHYPPPGWSIGADNVFSNTNLSLAINHMNSIGESINEDLTTAEQEVNGEGAYLTAASIPELNEFCRSIEDKIQSGYREAAAKVVRMDIGRSRNTTQVMKDNIRMYLSRLRQLKSDIRRASSATPSLDTRSTPVQKSSRGGL